MRLTEILKPQNIKVPLAAKTKTEAISELVDLLASTEEVSDAKKVLDAVLERESTRTTGIGNGLAIPHGKCSGVGHLVMAIGRPAQPIDFQAIDGRPVNLIWLLASPPDQTGPHIHALAHQPADDHRSLPPSPGGRSNSARPLQRDRTAREHDVIRLGEHLGFRRLVVD